MGPTSKILRASQEQEEGGAQVGKPKSQLRNNRKIPMAPPSASSGGRGLLSIRLSGPHRLGGRAFSALWASEFGKLA